MFLRVCRNNFSSGEADVQQVSCGSNVQPLFLSLFGLNGTFYSSPEEAELCCEDSGPRVVTFQNAMPAGLGYSEPKNIEKLLRGPMGWV